MAKNTICLWYDKDAEAAARFYAATFPTARQAPSAAPSACSPARFRIRAG
jgi:predicted 3-demethylubiquinone-9 3-methyltransferase (glyoxalase superfamily)